MTPATPAKVRIDPEKMALLPGTIWNFSLLVNGNIYTDPVNWTVDNPDVGKFTSPGGFQATDDYTYPKAQITATSADGKYTAKAEIRIQVYRGLMDKGPTLVDDYFVPGIIAKSGPALMRPMPWNDSKGRRAAALIFDALDQLPQEYLEAAGDVKVIRVDQIAPGRGGMHLPLFERLIVLSEAEMIGPLTESPGITAGDVFVVQSIVHEMAHVIMANRALPDGVRLELVAGLVIGAVAPVPLPGVPIPLPIVGLIPVIGLIYAEYFSPGREAGDDLARFAKVAGWVINNPNPFGMFFKANKATPNVVTGLIVFGKWVGLRNDLQFLPIPTGPPLTDAEIEQHRRDSGYPRSYAATDAHEDWACTMEALGVAIPAAYSTPVTPPGSSTPPDPVATSWVADSILQNPHFIPKAEFAFNLGIWPRSSPQVVPGGRLARYARAHKKPDPDMSEWAVYFGLNAGKSTASKHVFESAAKSFDDSWLGEGQGVPYEDDDTNASFRLLGHLDKLSTFEEPFEKLAVPAIEKVQAEVENFAGAVTGDRTVEFLRVAECHGAGLTPVQISGASFPAEGLGLAIRAETGDLLCSDHGVLYVVVRVDDKGRVMQVTGDVPIEGDDQPRAIGLVPSGLRYLWRPSRAARVWKAPDASPGAYKDLDAALIRMVGLWGESTTEAGKDLKTPGGFVSEALDAAGLESDAVSDLDDADLQRWCGRHGMRTRLKDWTGVAVGDLLRFNDRVWGVCTRITETGAPQDAVIQGGTGGPVGEDQDAVKMRHRFDPNTVVHVWRPVS